MNSEDKAPRLSRNTAHLVRSVPVMSLVAALLRIWSRRPEQMKLNLGERK